MDAPTKAPTAETTSTPTTEAKAETDFDEEVASLADQIRALRAQGLSARQIRERLPGTSPWTINCAINRDSKAQAVHPGLRARAKDAERERARALRLNGKTYKQIRAELGVSSATLSMWLRDLPYPEPDRAAHAAHMRQVQKERTDTRRTAEKAAAFAQIGDISDRELMMLGVALYWAEGAKDKPYSRRECIVFINSDAGMVRLFLRWLDLLGVEEVRRQYRVSIHETADVADAEDYWRSVIGLPGVEFRRATLKRHNPKTVRKRVNDDYHGCLIVTLHRSASLYRQVEGWWRGIVEARDSGGVPD